MVFHLSLLGFLLLALCNLSLQIYVTKILIIVDIELDPILRPCFFLFLFITTASTRPSHPLEIPSSSSILTDSAWIGFESMGIGVFAAILTERACWLHVLVKDVMDRRLSLMLLFWLFSVPGALGVSRGEVSALAGWGASCCRRCGWGDHSGLLHAKVHHFGDLLGLFCQLTEGYVPPTAAGWDAVSRLELSTLLLLDSS